MQVVVQSMNGDVAGTLDANYGKGPGERSGVERDVVAQQVVVPCNVDGADVAPTLRGFGHGWQGQHNTTNAVWVYDGYNQRLADDGVTGSMRTRFDSSDFVAYPEPVLFEPMSLREENWVGRDTKNALRAEASKSSHAVVSAWPLNERGREDGSRLEMGEEGVYNTLAAGDGSSSRRQLVLAEERHTQTEESMTPANNLVVRRLTPLECELLMGWEPGWTAEGVEPDGTVVRMADTHRYRMCGNGVVSNVGEWIARRYLKALSDSALDVEGSSVPRPEAEGSAG
jgi:site-specific DNA-cytosine methylase